MPTTLDYRLDIPRAFRPLLSPCRYKVFHGGRGSAKSWSFAECLILRACQQKTRFLCTREYQNSIEDSVYKLLSDTVDRHGLGPWFKLTRASIVGPHESEFLFEGLHRNTNAIRSIEGIDICWVEEAAIVSEDSWQVLIPTIRKEGSEIWASFNPEAKEDPAYRRFVLEERPDAIVRKVTWRDNPWFPKVLRLELEHDRGADADLYAHVWEGEPRKISASQVMHGKWIIEDFATPADAQFYCGADWGFSSDPTAIVRCFVKENRLYVDREAGGVGVGIDETHALLDAVLPSRRWPCRGDSARPETIAYLNKQGYRIIATRKGPGSVEDGIAYLRSFDKVVVHPRCRQVAEEMRLYSYKVDRITGDVLPLLVDAHNHYCVAGWTKIATTKGDKRADRIKTGCRLETRSGNRNVVNAMKRRNIKTLTILTSGGNMLTATSDHPLIGCNGIVNMDSLRYDTRILEREEPWNLRRLFMMELHGADIRNRNEGATGYIFKKVDTGTFTGKSIQTFMVRYLKAVMFTILTAIQLTIISVIFKPSRRQSITRKSRTNSGSMQPEYSRNADTCASGMLRKLAGNGTACTPSRHGKTGKSWISVAFYAEKDTKRKHSTRHIVRMHANRKDAGRAESMILKGHALFAGLHIELADTTQAKLAEGRALIGYASGKKTVYNLEVEENHEYFSNGILSHNCDSLRYAMEEHYLGKRVVFA